ncbi:hypothetical protein J437_LFUL003549 [Ladona fulva]|uniref:Nucleolar protein 16 n=1 Tax=Ladona fulva TaxID=123851 RepID=A0A8K0NX16_LADFU|nr:hypothetical protein J437_LFUL003549 [Ladona fulva]
MGIVDKQNRCIILVKMTKVRKQKKKKTYRHSSNRRRLGVKMRKLPKIKCPQIKEAWCGGKSVKRNMEEMGLVFDANKAFKIPTTKELLKREKMEEPVVEKIVKPPKAFKKHVAEQLEAEAKAPREKNLRLPNSEAKWLAFLIDKYGEDYKLQKDLLTPCKVEFYFKPALQEMSSNTDATFSCFLQAMARDPHNYYQETWKQLRGKIKILQSIPGQLEEHLQK